MAETRQDPRTPTRRDDHAARPRGRIERLAEAPPANRAKEAESASPEAREEACGLEARPPELTRASPMEAPDRYSTKSLDRAANAHLARFTLGVSPYGLSSVFFTWAVHLMGAPGKQLQLAEKAARKAMRFAIYAGQAARDPDVPRCIEPLPHDHRFDHPSWRHPPYNLIHQGFLLTQQWWYNAACDLEGVSERDAHVVSFVTRQMLDLVSPSNFVATNPEVAGATLREGGANLGRGAKNFLEDWERAISGKAPVGTEHYLPGRELATTPGKVVFRNRLLELIQYAPATETVQAEPIMIVPAWIMKYYILDLSPENSLVAHLVSQGFTVFIASWRNPTAEDRDMGMADYLAAVDAALAAVNAIVPDRKVHGVGYCLGGTLLAAKAAQMGRDGDDRFATLTLLATQTDFEEPGEMQLFISESEVSFLENMMWDQGYLDTKQMAGAFQLLRSADLIWSRYVHEYLMGRRQDMFDMLAWNADATRMPFKMHSEYLRRIFLNNELAEGQYEINGAPVAIGDIDAPIFCVSTTSDHVAPWTSVYKLHLLADVPITFVLTNGGHNAGIVSEPGHKGREFRIRTTREGDPFLSSDAWTARAEKRPGSWWPALVDWLRERSGGAEAPPAMGAPDAGYPPLADAPGEYVHQR